MDSFSRTEEINNAEGKIKQTGIMVRGFIVYCSLNYLKKTKYDVYVKYVQICHALLLDFYSRCTRILYQYSSQHACLSLGT
jgi:hypothetical protein